MRRFVLVAAGLGLLFVSAAVHAGERQQVSVGPRAIAMGGAFTSIADDASALFWNPAGLARIGHQELSGTHADLFGVGIIDNHLSFVLPVSPAHALAADWYRSGYEDPELDFGENRIDAAWSYAPSSRLSLGLAGKLLTRNTALDGSTVREGRGFGLDAGILVGPFRGVRVGVVSQDVLDTEIDYSGAAGSVVAYPRSTRISASYTHRDWATVAMDMDDRWHLGLEATPGDLLALRAGFQSDVDGEESPVWSCGAGVKLSIFRFDYAYEIHPELDATSHLGLSLAFNFNPAQIRIEEVRTRELYASLHKTYAHEPIGTAKIRNLTNEPLVTRLGVAVPGFTETPTEKEVVLRPGAVHEVPLFVVFPASVMGTADDRVVPVEVRVSYRSARVVRTDRASGRALLYAPGAIDWGEGVERAGAFVTPRDPVVAAVAREAGRTAARMPPEAFPTRNIGFAAAMFDMLDALGMAYVPDPNNPYSVMSESGHAVDVVHYPRETLGRRVGDCDDLSVLMAAMLGNVGVPVQLVDVPGHLMVLVATGLHERQRPGLPVEESLFTVVNEELWIPVETTALGTGFATAWRRGAEAYRSWEERGSVRLVDVAAAQRRFEPSLPEGPTDAPAIDMDDFAGRLNRDAEGIRSMRDAYLAGRFGAIEKTPPGAAGVALNEIAHVYWLAGRLEEARTRLERLVEEDADSPRANNNLAAVYLRQGDFEAAAARLRRVVARGGEDAGMLLNLAMAEFGRGRDEEARRVLAAAGERAGSLDAVLAMLGVISPPDGQRAGLPEEAERLLRSSPETLPVYWKP